VIGVRILTLVGNDHSGFFRQQVAGIKARGHEVEVLPLPGYSKAVDRTVGTYARYYVRAVTAAFGAYDLVHANYGLTAPPAILQALRPVVLTLWGSDLMGKYGGVSRLCGRFADEVIVMSEEMAAAYGHDCHVIPHGVDLELFRPLPTAVARRELDWTPNAHHVLFPYDTGRKVKDFPRAERIVDRIRPSIDAPVTLHTVSGVSHESMPLYMNAADALLLTSKREGMPNAVKEAMACNLPVVATGVSDLPTLLSDVSPSVAHDDDDVLADTLTEILRSGVRSDGRVAIEPLGVDAQIGKLESVYYSAVGDVSGD